MDEILEACNETELIWIAKRQGLGRLRRGLPLQELRMIVTGEISVTAKHMSDSNYTRNKLAIWIHNPMEYPDDTGFKLNWGKFRSQLPGCTGICTKYDCSEGKHFVCLMPNENDIQGA